MTDKRHRDRELGQALVRLLADKVGPIEIGWTEAELAFFNQIHVHQVGTLSDISDFDWDLRVRLMDWRRENGRAAAAADADPQALGEALDAFLAGARAGLPDTPDALAELRQDPVTGYEHGLIEAMKIARGADTVSGIEPADESLLKDLRIWANFTPGPRVAAEAATAREVPSPAPR